MQLRRRIFTLFVTSAVCVYSTAQADWPRYLGPNYDAISRQTGLARSWPPPGPTVLWTVDIAKGFGGPSVRDGEVYLIDREDGERDILRCLDLETGNERWRVSFEAPGTVPPFIGSSTTPSIGERWVYVVGRFGHVYCVDRKTHKPAWTLNTIDEFDANPPRWGFSHSPLLYRNLVIMPTLSNKVGLVALDGATGDVVWKSEPIGTATHASPILLTVAGKKSVVMAMNSQITAIDPDNGKIQWLYKGFSGSIIASPAFVDENRIFITSGYEMGSVMLRVTFGGDATASVTELFRFDKRGAQIHTPIIHGGHIYANFNTNENLDKNPEGLVCLDFEGNFKWQTKDSPHFNRGTLLLADDLLFVMEGKTGELYLVDPTPNGFQVLDKAKVLEGKDERIWAPMAITDGKLLVRDQHQLKCLRVGH